MCIRDRAAPGGRPWPPASAPESERTCAARARQLPTSCSWPHPRAIWHDEAVGLHLFIAKLPAGIVNEHIVQCRVLDRESLDLHFGANRKLHQFRGCLRTIAAENAVHVSAHRLYRGDAVSYTHLTLPTKRIV